MKFLSLDLETTGVDPKTNQILEIGAILFDTEKDTKSCPAFDIRIKHPKHKLNWHERARQMNDQLYEEIYTLNKTAFAPKKAFALFEKWLEDNVHFRVTVCGKNIAGFDIPFLQEAGFPTRKWFDSRVIDPAILFWKPSMDEYLPGSSEMYRRAGINQSVSHRALDDAAQVGRIVWQYAKMLSN